MKRSMAMLVALVLPLLVTTPAAAAKPVVEFRDLPFDFTFDILAGELCALDVTYWNVGTESLKFWYPNGADPATEPWTKGPYQRAGVDSFTANGNTVAGYFRFDSHLCDLALGEPVAWWETVSGIYWGIQIPREGPLLHEAGNLARP